MQSETHLLLRYLKVNYIFYFGILTILFLFSIKNLDFSSNFFSLIIIMTIGYLIHLFAHKYNFEQLLHNFVNNHFCYKNEMFKNYAKKLGKLIDFHSTVHHDPDENKKIKNLFFEFLHNFIFQGFVPFLFLIISRKLNPKIFIIWGLFYASMHIINYSIVKPESHKQHHELDEKTNYGLEIMDIIFNSKYDDEIENHNHGIINMIILFFVFYFLK